MIQLNCDHSDDDDVERSNLELIANYKDIKQLLPHAEPHAVISANVIQQKIMANDQRLKIHHIKGMLTKVELQLT